MKLRVLVRLFQIQRVLLKYGLDDFVRATHLYRPLRLIVLVSPWIWHARRKNRRGAPLPGSSGKTGQSGSDPTRAQAAPARVALTRATRLRLALTELGPIFVKFGQAVSTRRDLLPPDIADELVKLQDQVPPFPAEVARAGLERAYGRPLSEVFERFDEAPLAAASIAQVHTARLPGGKEAVVKVLRPGMRQVIERDLEVLYALARLAQQYWPEGRRLRPVEVVSEYEKTVLDELDLMREAANAAQLRRNFAGSDLLYVPEVYWDYCRDNVMVMERIRGIPISDMARLREAGTDIPKLAQNGVRIFFTQVFRHNFFHADMHPGNIFVLADEPRNPRYAAVDFGIVGTLDPRDQRYLADNFLAVFDRDYRRVARLHVESGWVPPDTRVDEMESAVRTVCEPIFDRPLKDISFGHILLRLFEISRRFNMVIQPQLVLLQKTLLNVEGLGRELYPELDIWNTASPILRQWMRERMTGRAVLQSLRSELPELIEAVRTLAPLAKAAAYRAQNGALRLKLDLSRLESLERSIRVASRRRESTIVGAAILLGGLVWLAAGRPVDWPGWAMLAIGAVWVLGGRRG